MTKQRSLEPNYDIIIIGAGPAGSLAASLLTQQNFKVLVIEKQHFPRFSIGESLLPQSMVYLQQANLLKTIEEHAQQYGFQHKNGAAFATGHDYSEFNFNDKFSTGPDYIYQVKRASFDHLLAKEAERQGAQFAFGQEVTQVDLNPKPRITVNDVEGQSQSIEAEFLLDASGFGRVLPRLLNLIQPSDFPVRTSVFCHVQDNIDDPTFDRNKILIETHPTQKDIWYWLIPFADGTASSGCVAKSEFFDTLEIPNATDDTRTEMLFDQSLQQSVRLKQLLSSANKITPVQNITGYSANVKQLHGDNYALLGNAGEFLDPIFSSGVTIAFKSAQLACDTLVKQFSGQDVCWDSEFAQPLQQGVNTFKAFVNSWYSGTFQDIVYYQQAPDNIRQMICSVLAGYAWDQDNPFVQKTERRLAALGTLCAS